MKQHAIEGDYLQWVINALRQSRLFSSLDQATIDSLIPHASLSELDANEVLMKQGDPSESFYLVLMGEISVFATDDLTGEPVEVALIHASESCGEMGALRGEPRTATGMATKSTYVVEFPQRVFDYLMDNQPSFSRRLTLQVADRLAAITSKMPMPEMARADIRVPDNVLEMLPENLILSEHVLPVLVRGDWVTVGFVDKPSRDLLDVVRSKMAGKNVQSVRIAAKDFDDLTKALGIQKVAQPDVLDAEMLDDDYDDEPRRRRRRAKASGGGRGKRPKRPSKTTGIVASVDEIYRIEPLMRRMIEAGASDLHLAAHQEARWRIDGEIHVIPDFPIPGDNEVYEILEGLLPDRAHFEFEDHHDCDFAFALEDTARFRCNMYRDDRGVGAAFRLVPYVVPSMDQLGLPKGAQRLTELNQGLVLVCGPTGSGKSTTLAAMLDHINNRRRTHIITIEDPIEFRHTSKVSMVNQREVGKNTSGFQRALRSGLREDPDIVLVGELRDIETMGLAMETAQTGHLVFSTLHTNTAISTVDRIIDMFPVEQHNQIRSTLADVLKGVINQVLCKRTGGGRVAAFETLIASSAVANCIRTGKVHQIATIMTTNRNAGNCTMNEDLESLVRNKAISRQEAILRSPDRKELKQRFGMP